jgi:uncharacterized protein (TIGR03790 family)
MHVPQRQYPPARSARPSAACAALMYLLLHLHGALAADADRALLPKHRIQADELAVIVNDADPLSVRIGNYYATARRLPPENLLHVRFHPGTTTMNAAAFGRLRARVEQTAPGRIQAYAITWSAPYRVECMSITSALTFGFDYAWCSRHKCAATRSSPYFRYRGATPWQDLGIRPTISIAATDFADARALIDRGLAADATEPRGTAYLVSTSDKARNVRALRYAQLARDLDGWLDTEIVESDALEDRDDVLFYFTGKARVEGLDTLRFVPGALADHLTSTGGRLTDSRQMSALRWLEAGASGSYGTVVEPCNRPGKFPDPRLLIEAYTSGRTLIEAYWQSVSQPGEGIFIGDPLVAPFDRLDVEAVDDLLILHTRSLQPGDYRIGLAQDPVGPYVDLPELLTVRRHQRDIRLPRADTGYYRLSPAREPRVETPRTLP